MCCSGNHFPGSVLRIYLETWQLTLESAVIRGGGENEATQPPPMMETNWFLSLHFSTILTHFETLEIERNTISRPCQNNRRACRPPAKYKYKNKSVNAKYNSRKHSHSEIRLRFVSNRTCSQQTNTEVGVGPRVVLHKPGKVSVWQSAVPPPCSIGRRQPELT